MDWKKATQFWRYTSSNTYFILCLSSKNKTTKIWLFIYLEFNKLTNLVGEQIIISPTAFYCSPSRFPSSLMSLFTLAVPKVMHFTELPVEPVKKPDLSVLYLPTEFYIWLQLSDSWFSLTQLEAVKMFSFTASCDDYAPH